MKPLLTATCLFISLLLYGQKLPPDTVIRGVKVCFRYSVLNFPETWQAAPISAKGEPIAATEVNRSRQVIINAMNKYSAGLLQKHLRAVYFLRTMSFYEVGYGGTNSADALYLTNEGVKMGYSDLYLEQTFHHEFSSILYRNNPSFINENAWLKANINGFSYNDPEKGVGAIRNNQSSQDFDTSLCAKGFLTQYAMSGMENDINTVAQNLFSPSPGFWDIADRYPRIHEKVKLLISFYHKLDPLFTEQYFRKTSNR